MTEAPQELLDAFVAGAREATFTEQLAVLLGVIYIVLAIRRHRGCWIAGGAGTALYVLVFLDARLLLQAALQVLYVAMAVYGWVAWRPEPGTAVIAPRRWTLRPQLAAGIAVLVLTAVTAPLLGRYTEAAAPLADALGTWASVAATWMLARRVLESWIWWIAIDAGLALLFLSQGLAFTAALYLAYAFLAIAGWRAWRGALEPAA